MLVAAMNMFHFLVFLYLTDILENCRTIVMLGAKLPVALILKLFALKDKISLSNISTGGKGVLLIWTEKHQVERYGSF